MNPSLILASGSPRRKELLEQVNVPFTVHVSKVEEVIDPSHTPSEAVMSLALQKAKDVAESYSDALVLGADTVVVQHNSILGKPKDEQQAKEMLRMLSGQTHQVLTGVALVQNEQIITFYEQTDVTFYPLKEEEIARYVQSGEPMDKAGSYGIQGLGAIFVKEIKGDYFSVVGLPLSRTVRELEKIGFHYTM
ncbi:Maf family protein [Metabacillus iocasae]|uniref:dTTP/UTP pyrophosphatase n=1 Tax=Priestia iocasae TaxID=2291674 RepID=A0ABS2QPX2_9BACI|nr:Maf family protein [Metabacillus iocasae]MBM7701363.1 septum formation protein [Metabacillus iocasae]